MAENQDLSDRCRPHHDNVPSNEEIIDEVIKTFVDNNKGEPDRNHADKLAEHRDAHVARDQGERLSHHGGSSEETVQNAGKSTNSEFGDRDFEAVAGACNSTAADRDFQGVEKDKPSANVGEMAEGLTKSFDDFEIRDTNLGATPNNDTDNSAKCSEDYIPDDFDKDEKPATKLDDDFVDEEALKDAEVTYSEEDKKRLQAEAESLKCSGNEQFKSGKYVDSAQSYTQGLRICPLVYAKDRAILYANRAAAKVKLSLKAEAIEDCTKAVELDATYLKAYYRRAQLYEETDKLDEALADYQKILQLDPLHREALYASKRLPDMIQERNEKLKADMLAKLKDLGNMILRPFNLSTENFQINQDPNTGGYSVNFVQNRR